MKALSRRERVFVGIFFIALVWGAWNYRHVFDGEGHATAPMQTHTSPVPPPVNEAVQTGGNARAAKTAVQTELAVVHPWESDPFHRDWRRQVQRESAP